MTLCRGNPLWLPLVVKYLFICASVLSGFFEVVIKVKDFWFCESLII